MSTTERDFKRCTKHTLSPDGTQTVKCRLGLWAVSGRSTARVMREARRYWVQYFADGEYANLLSAPKPRP